MKVRWWHALLPYARPYRGPIALIALIALSNALVTAALPWPAKLAIDHVLVDRPLPSWAGALDALPGSTGTWTLIWLGVVSVILYLARAVLIGLQRVTRATTGQQMSLDLASDVLEAAQRRSLVESSGRATGDIVRRIVNDTRAVDMALLGVGLGAFSSLTTLGLMLVVTTNVDAGLAGAAFVGALPLLLLLRSFVRPMRERSIAKANADGAISAEAEHALSHVSEIQSFTAEERQQQQFEGVVTRWYDETVGLQRVYSGYDIALGAFTGAGTALVFLVGGFQAIDGTTSVGDLVVVTSYIAMLFGPITALANLAQVVHIARAGTERMQEILASGHEVPEPVSPVVIPSVGGGARVAFEAVSFGYEPGVPVLDGIDCVVEPGETVALVGATGAGKSTLAGLVPRFFDPWSGRVTLNGVDLRDATTTDVRSMISVVRQEPILLPVSVAANIAYGKPDATRDEVLAAADAAQASEFVNRMPDGFETVLGERGATLSGGQRQRLAIARALLKDAPVLILDEPTSALDAESEAAVVAALERVARDRTVFVIAHRLSTVRRADRIIVLDRGRVVETGTHDQLLAADGHYARYHRLHLSRFDATPST